MQNKYNAEQWYKIKEYDDEVVIDCSDSSTLYYAFVNDRFGKQGFIEAKLNLKFKEGYAVRNNNRRSKA
tara:strand:- start:384 stop:590 length:207 start_codon:yes stop_codon:yes gene_type:complete